MLLRAALVPPEEALSELWTATDALRKVPGTTPVPPEHLDIPIVSFGNLLPPDCDRLAGVLRSAFEGAEGPVVRFQDVTLEDETTVVVALGGDTGPVADLARFVPEAAERLGLYVDRRRFSLQIMLASVAPTSSPTLLSGALACLEDWTGSPWSVPGLSLIRTRWSQGKSRPEEYDRIAMR
ncbi:hypothetical protein SFC88_13230 [Nocardioides sp. HM23]|uniref:2'-5' RNA ligase family protein n=1 Tax=Nocardioides bizhenqiangii TaxID=3095076 RepID=UPI002ACA68E7|nr:hypothetical protein [Nocardioides sp. HM23]MDZ5621802.1 hypothetical protein [Nocardioides sp. HM23]